MCETLGRNESTTQMTAGLGSHGSWRAASDQTTCTSTSTSTSTSTHEHEDKHKHKHADKDADADADKQRIRRTKMNSSVCVGFAGHPKSLLSSHRVHYHRHASTLVMLAELSHHKNTLSLGSPAPPNHASCSGLALLTRQRLTHFNRAGLTHLSCSNIRRSR